VLNTYDATFAAIGSLRANPLRSALTALGIVIGVAAVVTMVSIGLGAQARIEQAIRDIGSNMLVIGNGSLTSDGRRSARGDYLTLTEGDAAALARNIPTVEVAAGSVRGASRLVLGNRNWFSQVWGVTPDYFIAHNWSVVDGRILSDAEVRASAKVALLGQTVARELFSGRNPVGGTIRIERVPFTVIGVLHSKGPDPWLGSDQDDLVLIPLATAKRRVLGNQQGRMDLLSQITVKVTEADAIESTERAIGALLRQRHNLRDQDPDDFFVSNVTDALNARSESSRVMSRLLAAIAAISLLVGGIGIMNIMLVAVTERTREIGLRMAVGATPADIRAQFLVEAGLLAAAGGVVGVLLGIAGALVVSYLAGWPVRFGLGAMGGAVAFSAAVGVAFGLYPARRAARLDPIEALRAH
jgi:putative ABC transport system permease protein